MHTTWGHLEPVSVLVGSDFNGMDAFHKPEPWWHTGTGNRVRIAKGRGGGDVQGRKYNCRSNCLLPMKQQKHDNLCNYKRVTASPTSRLPSPAPTVSLTRNIEDREVQPVGFGLDEWHNLNAQQSTHRQDGTHTYMIKPCFQIKTKVVALQPVVKQVRHHISNLKLLH